MIIDPAVQRLLRPVLVAAVVWGLVALLGGIGLLGLAGAVGLWFVSWRQSRELRAADRAISTHTDPGPDARAEADSRARSVLARPRYEDWLGVGVVLAVGAACVVVAAVRQQPGTAVPGAVLVVLAPVLWFLDRQGLLAASRWLDSPPFDRPGPA